MIFLGTGAAECVPNIFCGCRVCQEAMASDDPREKRGRSAFLLNDRNLIDYGPDIVNSCIRFRCPLQNLRNIFVTHSHADHWDWTTFENMTMTLTGMPYLRVFLSQEALDGFDLLRQIYEPLRLPSVLKKQPKYREHYEFIPLKPFETYDIDEMKVTPLPTTHPGHFNGEHAQNYLFEKPEHSLLYASDTGPYPEENYEFLCEKHLDTFILEGTFGAVPPQDPTRHLNAERASAMIHRLISLGTVDDRTAVYITHIGHKGQLTHREYEQRMEAEFGPSVRIAYDGLSVGEF